MSVEAWTLGSVELGVAGGNEAEFRMSDQAGAIDQESKAGDKLQRPQADAAKGSGDPANVGASCSQRCKADKDC